MIKTQIFIVLYSLLIIITLYNNCENFKIIQNYIFYEKKLLKTIIIVKNINLDINQIFLVKYKNRFFENRFHLLINKSMCTIISLISIILFCKDFA